MKNAARADKESGILSIRVAGESPRSASQGRPIDEARANAGTGRTDENPIAQKHHRGDRAGEIAAGSGSRAVLGLMARLELPRRAAT